VFSLSVVAFVGIVQQPIPTAVQRLTACGKGAGQRGQLARSEVPKSCLTSKCILLSTISKVNRKTPVKK